MPKPQITDYPSFYAGYIGKVPEGNVPAMLRSQSEEIITLFESFTEDRANFSYAPGKWTLKEVLGHIIDAERVFTYRALCMARGDQQPLPGMNQDLYVSQAQFATRSLKSLIEEYDAVRKATLSLIDHLTEADLSKTGTANQGHFTVNALIHIICGHELHHIEIVKAHYL